jgi:ubiquinone/menaquinone biosynthesis C-methylase UbiE
MRAAARPNPVLSKKTAPFPQNSAFRHIFEKKGFRFSHSWKNRTIFAAASHLADDFCYVQF